MDYSQVLGLDRERMERQVGFLKDRARWHDRRETPLDRACAATARRDSGIIALLLGKTNAARTSLAHAGRDFLSIGLFSGYLLQSLAEADHDARAIAEDGMLERIRQDDASADPKARRERDEGLLHFERLSRESPSQLLNLYQALRIQRVRDLRLREAAEMASIKLRKKASLGIGLTDVPMQTYLRLFDHFGVNDVSERDIQTLFAISAQRRDLIDAARVDEYHWRMLLKPTVIVDLDFIALGMTALEAGERSSSMLFETTERLGVEAALPFLLARDLYQPPTEEPQPLYRGLG